ncbi:MAG: fluoride efflux transporter CrcB, partial [Bacteroidia bacterium]|nr:fluoride efflux transporter CrcB [Bacteroidia bacterium]
MKNILLVALGGGTGSVLRYLCSRWIQLNQPGSFPWGTFAVNISGCLL